MIVLRSEQGLYRPIRYRKTLKMDIENIDTEWKESWSDKYLKTVAAFYNTKGGRMVIGRRDDGEYIGLQDVKGLVKSISDSIHNKLHIVTETRAADFDGKECIVIDVSKGDSIVDFDGRFYFRVGSTTQQLEGDPLKTILLGEKRLQWLDQPCRSTFDDISAKAISYFVRKAKSAKRIPPSVKSQDAKGVLERFGLLYEGEPDLAACILFSEDPVKFNRGAYVKVGVFDSRDLLVRDECFYGPLVSMPDRVMEALYEKYIPPRYGFGNGSATRYYIYDYPEDAVREILVNAIAHMDFSKEEPVTVKVCPDKVRIFSFGNLPDGWTTEKLVQTHNSVRRNKSLSEVFYAMGLVENWAQGISKVLESCESNGNPPPEFNMTPEGLEVFIYPILSENDTPPPIPASSFRGTDEKDETIIKIIMEDPSVTSAKLAAVIGVTKRTAERRLSKLQTRGLIRRVGSNKGGVWEVITEEE